MTTRREFVGALGALGALGAAALGGRVTPPRLWAPHVSRLASHDRITNIGLELYTVRGEMQRDFDATVARVAEIGYREVEFAGYFGRTPGQVKAVLDRNRLAAPSAHVPIEELEGEWARTLDDARAMGHEYLIVAWIPEERRRTLDGWRRVADLFNRAGQSAKRAGLGFGFHNHSYEFVRLEDRIPYDVFVEACDPRHVVFEMDLYWITKGGGDPLAYFARYPGRFPLVHVKDMDSTPQQGMVDVGQGIIDWRRIFAHRAQAGIRHFLVEHDQPRDPFASIRASYQYLSRLEF